MFYVINIMKKQTLLYFLRTILKAAGLFEYV